MRIVCVTIDARDPAALAEFWTAALGWGGIVVAPDGGGSWPEGVDTPSEVPIIRA